MAIFTIDGQFALGVVLMVLGALGWWHLLESHADCPVPIILVPYSLAVLLGFLAVMTSPTMQIVGHARADELPYCVLVGCNISIEDDGIFIRECRAAVHCQLCARSDGRISVQDSDHVAIFNSHVYGVGSPAEQTQAFTRWRHDPYCGDRS